MEKGRARAQVFQTCTSAAQEDPCVRARASADAASHAQMGITDLPDALTDALLEDDDVIQRLHHALLEVHLEEGALVCPETGRRFPVSRGIPNMLLNEDEV